MANVNATTGTDNFNGSSGTTSGDDQISVTAQNRIQSGDLFDGGGGYDTLRATASINFTSIVDSASSGIKNMERVLYTTGSTLTFRSDQFGSGLISDSVNITGVTGSTQTLAINMSLGDTLDMSGWTFTNWTAGTDLITVTGSASTDTLVVGTERVTYNGGASLDTVDFSALSGQSVSLTLNGSTAISATTSTGAVHTLSNVEYVIGTGGDDTINGDSAANIITGGAGNDTLSGGGGDDKFILSNGFGTDTITGGESGETSGDSILARGATGNLTVTYTGNEAGTITDGSNTATFSQIERVVVGAGNDTMNAAAATTAVYLDGSAGNDTLTGGSGNDTLIGDGDLLINGSLEAGMPANSVNYVAVEGWKNASGDVLEVWGNGFNGESAADGVNFVEIDNTGTLNNDTLYQDVNTVAGQTYTLTFTASQREANVEDVAIYWDGALVATVRPASGLSTYTYSLTAAGSLTRLEFREIAAQSNGLGVMLDAISLVPSGDDVLDGGAGADTMTGGAGHDTYYVDNVGDVVVDRATDAGTDLVYSSITFAATGTNQDGVENITLTGSTNINATGNALNNIIIGNTGNNILTGGTGDDRLTGNAGNDILTGGANADRFVYDAHMLTAQSDVVTDFSVAQGDVIDLGTAGPASWEVLQGHLLFVDGANNAYLAGKWNGTDQLLTLSGINVGTLSAAQFVFDTSGDARNITGTANEDRIFGGLGNDTIYAGGGHDRIFGDAGDDLIYGEAGNDRIHTHAGNDTVYAGDGHDQIYGGDGDDYIDGGEGNNHLEGAAGNDTLIAGSGNDYMHGGTGADTMTGGAGADTYFVDDVGDVVVESVSDAGRDWVFTSISFSLGGTAAGVENATLEGTADLSLTGNALANVLNGNSGNNTLDGGDGSDTLNGGDGNDTLIGGAGNDRLAGGAGADSMTGGAGNDIYEVDDTGDAVNEAVGDGGTDTVNTSISFAMTGTAAGVENGTLLGTANLNLTGNALANILTGNGGHNVLDGGDGNDRLIGGGGDDTLHGGDGLDTLEGGQGNDTLYGGAGNDRIFGGAGDDIIHGGAGNDSLAGDTGSDTFVFEAGFGRDTINGFNAAEDKLNLTALNIDSAAELLPYATNSGANMLVTISTGNVITILNFSTAQVHDGMFVT